MFGTTETTNGGLAKTGTNLTSIVDMRLKLKTK